MIEKIDLGEPNIAAYEIYDELTVQDVERIHDDLRAALANHETVGLYTDVTEMEDVQPQAVFEDLKMTPEYIGDIDRYAIVGDEQWHEWLTRAGDVVSKGEAACFSPEEADRAREWVQAI